MVLNRAALELVQRALPCMPLPSVHDWWLYQLIAGAGGTVLHDNRPQLLYRQHGINQIGANATVASNLRRLVMMLGGTNRGWMDQNITALEACSALLTPGSHRKLALVVSGRDGPRPLGLARMWKTRLYRKGNLNHAALWLAAALHKL